ncbi:MAG: hypothetical protein ACON4E_00815 [Flavobacteriales bacterium]
MRVIEYTTHLIIAFLVIIGSVGIPVNYSTFQTPSHYADFQINTVNCNTNEQLSCCQSKTQESICCSTKEVEKECSSTLLSSYNYDRSLASCCCFVEVEFVFLSYDTPVYTPIEIPVFLEAYVVNLFNNYSSYITDSFNSLFKVKPPPLNPYSQQLAIFQVFRL